MHSLEHLDSLWNFSDPAASEAAFRRELGGDPLTDAQLTTQIARTYGLRGDFDTARTLLTPLAQGLEGCPAVVQALYWLEWGRAHGSTAHPSPLSDDQRAIARQAYQACLAASTGLDSLAVDALHMMAFLGLCGVGIGSTVLVKANGAQGGERFFFINTNPSTTSPTSLSCSAHNNCIVRTSMS